MIRSFLTVSSGTLASRLLGYLRDSMIASLLGASAIADAFLVAFQFVNVVRRLLSEGALNAALVPAWMKLRETSGAVAAASFAGAVLGTISAALIVAAALLGLLMPLVVTALAPGFAGHETLQLAVTDARLMLPYLAFAGPATVLLALASAQGRFFVTAFSPLLFNLALIAVMIALIVAREDAGFAALALAATVGIAGLLQLVVLMFRRGETIATPLRVSFDAGDARLLRPRDSRHDRERRAATARDCRRDHRLVLAVGGVVAVFRQPPDRAAARHGRRRHGHGADPGADARAARRRQGCDRACASRARWSLRRDWRCRRCSG